ncbi:MAG: hypothetical protein GXX82_13370 [Syntrophorhabdus sp.]|nr:hypothetical protein [Syntrophorhabdus sp.]
MRQVAIACVCLLFLFVGARAGSQETSPEVQVLRKEMLASPGIMALILSVQNEPDV